MHARFLVRIFVFFCPLLLNCSGNRPPTGGIEQKKQLTIAANFGNPVAGARLELWGNKEQTALIDEAVTDSDGLAEFQFYRQHEPVWVRTATDSGGRFIDLGTNITTELKTELRTLVEVHQLDGNEVALTPRTTEALGIALMAFEQGTPFLEAWHKTIDDLNAFLDCMDWGLDLVRGGPSREDGPADDWTQAAIGRYELGGLSAQAKRISEAYNRTVGIQDLWTALLEDILYDGLWDGLGPDGPVALKGGFVLSPSTQRWGDLGYAQGLRAWARSDHYQGGLTEQDVTPLAECIARATGPYFPDSPLGTPDFSGPFVRFDAPPAANFVHGDVSVVVTASDPAGVASFRLESMDGLSVDLVDLNASPPRIEATLDSGVYADGQVVEIIGTASDNIGNSASKALDINVLNSIPTPEVLLIPDDDTVSSRFNVGCDCSADIQAPINCSLVSPDPQDPNIEEISIETDRVLYSWQTEGESEGAYTISCQASIAGLERTAGQSRIVTIDNISSSSYCGIAPAEAEVRVWLFDKPDQLIATARVDDDGAFCVEIDYPTAPIVLEIAGRSTQIQRFATNQTISMSNNKLALYLDHIPGTHTTGLTPDGVTTMAVALCRGLRDSADVSVGSCENVHDTLNTYALADEALASDIRWVPMAPWGSGSQGAPRDAQYKLMWHAALDYLAEELGVTWLDFVTQGAADAHADALLDGMDDTDTQMRIRGYALDGKTFRSRLARAGLRLARGVPVGERTVDIPTGFYSEVLIDYLEHLAGFTSPYFDPEYGDDIDTDAPILTPEDFDQSMTGDVQICIGIRDDSQIVDGGFATDRDGVDLEDVTLQDGQLCGTLRTENHEDGAISIAYWVVDANGALAEGSLDGIYIANKQPEFFDFETPCILRDAQTTIEVCAKHEHLDNMRVVSPAVAAETFDRQAGSDTGCLTITMDPSSYAEGGLSLDVEAVGRGVPASRSYECLVNTKDPGSLQFCGFSDTCIAEAGVEACWLEADGSCEPLANAPALVTDGTGCVTVPLPDDREGQLHVRTRGGWYWSAVHQDDDGDPVRIYAPSDLGVTATYHYEPSRPATVLDGRRASYVTTWADAWALARLNDNTTTEQMTEILDEGYRRLGLHPGRDLNVDGIDIRTTTPRDLTGRTSHSSATSEASTRLGIIQVAVAQCAAMWSTNNGSAPDALPSLTLAAELIPRDAQNFYYDGLDATENRINAMGQTLDHNTLRHTMMTCGALWLDSSSNATTLRAQNFSQPDGFFVVTSSNQDHDLFGSLASDFVVFDRTPPHVTAVLVDQDLLPLPIDPIPIDRAVSLRIAASDDGGFAGTDGLIVPVVTLNPGPSEALGDRVLYGMSPTTLGVTHAIYLDSLNEGEQIFEVSQADVVGNTTAVDPIRLVVDRTPPIVTPNFPERTTTPVIDISWSSNETLSEVSIYSGARIVSTVTDGSMSVSVDLGECNAEYSMFLSAKDEARNTTISPSPVAVVCDDTPPEFLSAEVPTHTNSTQVPVSWRTSEPMASISILLDGTVIQTLDGTSREATVTLPSCESTHSIQLKGNDPAGNPGEGPVLTVTCETVAPNFLQFVVPENTTSTAIPVEWQVSETLQKLDIILNDVVVASITDGRTNYQISLPNCNEDFALRAIATDPAGNMGQSQERGVTCDDIRPQITAHSVPARIAGTAELAEMLMSWSATETISRLEITIGDVQQTLELDASTESAVVRLPHCNDELAVSMRAFDFTGNGSDPVGPDVVACDMYDPFVGLMVSGHLQENTMNIVCSVDSCALHERTGNPPTLIDLSQQGPHDIYHYKHRYFAGHEDMPFIEFQAADVGDVLTDDLDIYVEYFYHGSDGAEFVEWRPLERKPGSSRVYQIELSPESLLPSVYETDEEQLHTVTIRSRDEMGRYSDEVSVDFRLRFLFLPPVLSDAQLSDAITQRSLPDGNIHEFFTNTDSDEILTMQVYWPWGHDNVPTNNAVLDLSAADMQPRVSEMRQNKHYTSGYYWVGDYSGWSCGSTGHRVGDGSCRPGLAPTATIRRSGGETEHEMIYEVDGAVHLGLNRYQIEPNRAYTVRVGVRRPHVDIDGALYTWPQENGVYEYTLEHGQEYTRRRYREDPDTGETILELYSRRFDMQTYISELVIEMNPITVDASVGDLPVDVVAATDHEECIGPWSYTTSIN